MASGRRATVTRFMTVGLILAVLAGCDAPRPAATEATGGPAASPSRPGPSSLADPAAVLAPAVQALAGKGLTFELGSQGDRADGVYDPASGCVSLVQVQDGRRTQIVTTGTELYLVGFAVDGTVMRVDVNRLPDSHGLLPVADPLLALRLLTGVVEIQQSDVGTYTGTIDLARVQAPAATSARRIVDVLAKQAGDRAGAIAFTAAVDIEGRLKRFGATFPRADQGRDLAYEFVVVAFGTAIIVARPVGPAVVDAPPGAYAP